MPTPKEGTHCSASAAAVAIQADDSLITLRGQPCVQRELLTREKGGTQRLAAFAAARIAGACPAIAAPGRPSRPRRSRRSTDHAATSGRRGLQPIGSGDCSRGGATARAAEGRRGRCQRACGRSPCITCRARCTRAGQLPRVANGAGYGRQRRPVACRSPCSVRRCIGATRSQHPPCAGGARGVRPSAGRARCTPRATDPVSRHDRCGGARRGGSCGRNCS